MVCPHCERNIRLKTREEIPFLLRHMGLTGHGAEVGVGSGWFSAWLLKNSDLSRLYSIDPWGQGLPGQSNQNGVEWYLESVKLLSEFGLRSVVLRMLSAEAAALFTDGSLDFVYIDANHNYDQVKQDLAAWFPKIKTGGVFAGHDYCDFHWGVPKAVDEFAADTGATIELTELDQVFEGHEIRSWLVKK